MFKTLYYSPLFLCFLFSACAPYPVLVQTMNDPFTNTKKQRLEITVIPQERLVSSQVQFTFVKEQTTNQQSQLTLYAQLFVNNRQFSLQPDFYSLMDTQSYKKTVTNLETDGLLNQPIALADLDSSNTRILSYYNYTHCPSYRFTIPLSADEIDKLPNAQILAYRFYLGPREVTAHLSYFQLSRIKQLLES